MKAFADLYHALDATTRSSEKIAALVDYFASAPAEDAAWAVYFLTGERLRRLVTSRQLRDWCAEASGLPAWLVDASYDTVGDLSETLALLVPGDGRGAADAEPESLAGAVRERVEPLSRGDETARRAVVQQAWEDFGPDERLVYHKIVRGGFRVGVQKRTLARALAEVAGVDAAEMTHRMMALAGGFTPTARAYRSLLEEGAAGAATPYPFFLASPVDDAPRALAEAGSDAEDDALDLTAALGPPADWLIEWKWDGIRAQLVRRAGGTALWSRGEEPLDASFPELLAAAAALPEGTVLDGEIVAWEGDFAARPETGAAGDVPEDWREHGPLPFFDLQRRIGRNDPNLALFPDPPVRFVAFDVLESEGEDRRGEPLAVRRERLEALLERGADRVDASPIHPCATWDDAARLRARSRERLVEGLVLKRCDSTYRTGRVRGDWWKWKIDPFTLDAVLMYSQAGTGRRAGLLTDHTFGVWQPGAGGDELVPIAKAYGGLTDEEMKAVDRHLRDTTRERRGGVRIVEPELVFELAFEGVQRSDRHRAGLALRFPRMHRWRRDKQAADANRLEDVERLFEVARGRGRTAP